MDFTTADLVVLIVYMAAVTAWGIWLGRGQVGARDYFLGGRDLPWWAVLLSVVATETSVLTFLSIPGIAYATDLSFLQLTFGYLIGRTIVAFVLLPAYYRGELGTAYAALERRFGLSTRRFASSIFMVTRALADGVRLFATAIPLALITGWSYPAAILAIGLLTLVYTFYGGIRAVVWLDVVQLVVYMGGALGALWIISGGVPGGLGAAFSAAGEAGKLEMLRFDLNLSDPYTLWAGLLGGAFLSMASHGADQLIVQRLLTCRTLLQSRMALIGSGLMVIVQFALFLVIGIGLWAFYAGQPFERTDEIFAGFIIQELPVGVTGLVIASIFAAAMSSLSSSLNSLASASTYDIYQPLRGGSEAQLLRIGRVLTLVWGVVLVGGALLVQEGDVPVVELGLAIASFTYGGLLGGFFLGILNRRAIQRDALVAIGVGILTMTAIVFGERWAGGVTAIGWDGMAGVFTTAGAIAWPWHVVIGTAVTFGVGSLLSLTHRPPPEAGTGGTLSESSPATRSGSP